MPTCADWTGESNQANALYGDSVSTAGDVNGDGFDEILVGAPRFDTPNTDAGRIWAHFGSASGLPMSPSWLESNALQDDQLGRQVVGGVDINGDGYDDVLAGAPEFGNYVLNYGMLYVFHGSPNGLPADYTSRIRGNNSQSYFGLSVSAAGDVNGDGFDDVLAAQNQVLEVYHGSPTGLTPTPSTQITTPFTDFASAGDVNGDGFDDVIVGDWVHFGGMNFDGRAYLHFGTPTGLEASPSWSVEANNTRSYFGYAVAGAGDVNGDGFDDVVVGAFQHSGGEPQEGRAYVYMGSPEGLLPTEAWSYESNEAGAQLGKAVGGAGDVNGDGFDDVILGAPNYDDGEVDEGAALVFFGSALGPSSTPDWIEGSNQANANYASDVTTAGDVNGDGYDEVLVGGPGVSNPESAEGVARVFYGSASGPTVTLSATVFGRNAGANPNSYMAPRAIPGTTWTPTVDLTLTGHSHASILGATLGGSFPPRPGGQVPLISGTTLFSLPLKPGPTASWSIPLPNDPSLCGLKLHTQAVHLLGAVPYALTNAWDLVVGHP